jgi:ribosomal-protein-alanine N-acetyltransferase
MTDLKLLESERLIVSGWRPDQLDDVVHLHADPETARYLTEDGLPWSRDFAQAKLDSWIALFDSDRMGKMRLTRKSDGAFIGRAGYSFYPPTGVPEIGFALLPEFRGMGYATEAASALRDWLFRETAWDHFIGFADVRNTASCATLRRIGMVPTHVETTQGLSCQFHLLEKPKP